MKERHTRPALVVAILCTAILALSACVQVQPLPPANQLRLEVDFYHALSPSKQVTVDVNVLEDKGGHWYTITLPSYEDLSVNGRRPDADSPPFVTDEFTVPRPAAGGEYRIIYTDVHGKQTTVLIPAPQQALTITSPTVDSRLSSPRPGAYFTIHYTAPFPPASPFAQRPLALINGNVAGNCKSATETPAGTPTATPTEVVSSEPFCISVYSAQPAMNGTALVSDTGLVANAGFGNLAPGSGQVAIYVEVYGDIPTTTGFAGVRIHFIDSTSLPVTWV